jgi:hypothetical protein
MIPVKSSVFYRAQNRQAHRTGIDQLTGKVTHLIDRDLLQLPS